ncbi:hypothetical protein Q5H93_05325 [Hymenobacter sp. ASUV-10]|uniref:T9SS type A sorting domain-containing protein n=1 Tax=Hymenobacter aranciens TaxID=3063996 RepID=A0ABT9B7F9_9BACT|nr:hypothetical protein [Hymenobacter sp. ASUV-10]MDO7874145.1 hypothetical protein [Hymenobacter sp. ASUV-10]
MILRFTYLLSLAAWLLLLVLTGPPAARAQAPAIRWDWASRGSNTGAIFSESGGHRVQADAAGNSYITGVFAEELTLDGVVLAAGGGYASYVARYNAAGRVVWAQVLRSPNFYAGPTNCVVDRAGNLYLAGGFVQALTIGTTTLTAPASLPSNSTEEMGFVAKLSAQGVVQWAIALGPQPGATSGAAPCLALAIDAADNLAIAGSYVNGLALSGAIVSTLATDFSNLFVIRLTNTASATPTVGWVRMASGTPYRTTPGLAFDAAGHLYLSTAIYNSATFGSTTLPGGGARMATALVQYNAAGAVQWARQLPAVLPAGAQPFGIPTALAAPPTGGLYLLHTEVVYTPVYEATTQLLAYSELGALRWLHSLPTTNGSLGLRSVVTDASGNVYAGGYLQGTSVLGNLSVTGTTPASTDGVVFSFTPQGGGRWALPVAAGPGADHVVGLCAAGVDDLYVVGGSDAALSLGPFVLPTASTTGEVWTGHFQMLPLATSTAASAAALLLAPNPAHDFALLTLPAAPTPQAFALLDALGRPVRHYAVPAGATTARLDVAGLPAGLYVLRGAGASRKLVLE